MFLFSDLCSEIDYWKERADYFETKYEEEVQRNIEQSNNQLEQTNKEIGNALMLAFSVKDNEDGSISISKEDRKNIANRFKH